MSVSATVPSLEMRDGRLGRLQLFALAGAVNLPLIDHPVATSFFLEESSFITRLVLNVSEAVWARVTYPCRTHTVSRRASFTQLPLLSSLNVT